MESIFENMTRQELRAYILEHRDDEVALQIYLNRLTSVPGEIYPAPQTINDLNHFPQLLEKRHLEREAKSKSVE